MNESKDHKSISVEKQIKELRAMKEVVAKTCRQMSQAGEDAPWHLVENMNKHLLELVASKTKSGSKKKR